MFLETIERNLKLKQEAFFLACDAADMIEIVSDGAGMIGGRA